jgi:hypothetical protein
MFPPRAVEHSMTNTTTKKTALSAAELYVMLDREIRRRRHAECGDCYVQMPFPVDAANGANWEVMIPPGASEHCQRLINQVVEELAGRYLLAGE